MHNSIYLQNENLKSKRDGVVAHDSNKDHAADLRVSGRNLHSMEVNRAVGIFPFFGRVDFSSLFKKQITKQAIDNVCQSHSLDKV